MHLALRRQAQLTSMRMALRTAEHTYGSEANIGTDSGITLTVPPNIALIGIINCVANSTAYVRIGMSVAQAFGGSLPDHFGIVVQNLSGAALDASVGSANYQGILAQSV